jgi:hypothetical protein
MASQTENRQMSLYGQDMLQFVSEYQAHTASAYDAALYLLTHGNRCPVDLAVASLAAFDRAVFDLLREEQEIPISDAPAIDETHTPLIVYINSLGRLHIRNAGDERVSYGPEDKRIDVGYVNLAPAHVTRIAASVANAAAIEDREFEAIRGALDTVHENGSLPEVIEQVIDHVQHVESVCFYVSDTLFALIERYNNLVKSPNGTIGFLPRLRDVPYEQWSKDEILIVSALHALFLSGRSVRFEEFNGTTLTATALCAKLRALLQAYRDAGCVCDPANLDLFDTARLIRAQSLKSEGAPWLRYRWIYALTFQKTERILSSTVSTEDPLAYLQEFADDYEELVGSPPQNIGEREFFRRVGAAALERDLRRGPHEKCGDTATSCMESWMEKIVASAIIATDSDYGMSSSLRDLSLLLSADDNAHLEMIHTLKPADFFTCFVSKGFGLLEGGAGNVIADSVQRRMMFNRWHFIPGNFERAAISSGRHWYYPPVLPDIAIHSDVHRAGHERARVKFSVRAPGPDMSMPPISIGGRQYRGFYDVRVVRMTGHEYTTEEMLRTRRRTLWLSELYAALVGHLASQPERRIPVAGFQPGKYLDIETGPVYTLRTRSISMELA